MSKEIEMSFRPLWDEEELDTTLPATIPPPSRRRRIWLIALVIVLMISWGGGVFYWQLANNSTAQFMQAAAHIGNLSIKVSTTGTVAARAQYSMNFLSSGRVQEIDVQVGQHVEPGQVLAKLDIDKVALVNAINVAQVAVNTAQSTLTTTRINLGQAETNLGKVQATNDAAMKAAHEQEVNDIASCQNSGTSLHACQQTAHDKYTLEQQQASAASFLAQNQVNAAITQMKSAQSNFDLAQAQLNTAQRNMDDANANAILVAPVSTTVASINGIVGQNIEVSSSTTPSRPFMILTDLSHISITAQVNEADIGNIRVGQSAQFTVNSYPSTVLRANVSTIEMVGQTTSNVVNYIVNLAVDQNTLNGIHLYPGMTAIIDIITAQHRDALLIPSNALNFTDIAIQAGKVDSATISALQAHHSQNPDAGQDQSRIILVLRNNRLTPILITAGQGNTDFTEVLSGLRAGDKVVVDEIGERNTSSSVPW